MKLEIDLEQILRFARFVLLITIEMKLFDVLCANDRKREKLSYVCGKCGWGAKRWGKRARVGETRNFYC